MGMGSYDESEQERFETTQDADEDVEQVETETYEGDVSYETPDSADVLMDNFKEEKGG
jgi:translation elongation factor P/translation initiation factor 5A